MDTESVISLDGLAVMANSDTYIDEGELKAIAAAKTEDAFRKRDKKDRLLEQARRQQERQEYASSLIELDIIKEEEDEKEENHAEKEEAKEKHDDNDSPRPLFNDAAYQKELDMYRKDDIDFRIKQHRNNASEDSFDLDTMDQRRKDMETYRIALTMEEKFLKDNCSMFIEFGANIMESMCEAIDFHVFETRQLSEKMEAALAKGQFDACFKQYANMGGNDWMKNPYMNFVGTFCSIALSNHLAQKKSMYFDTKNKKEPKKKKKKRRPLSTDEDDDTDSCSTSSSSSSSSRSRRRRRRRRGRHEYPYMMPPPAMYHHPPPAHPWVNYYNHYNTPPPAAHPPPAARPSPKQSKEKKADEEQVTDAITGQRRVRMSKEVTDGMAMDQVTNVLEKFKPMLKTAKKQIEVQKQHEEAKAELELRATKPKPLF